MIKDGKIFCEVCNTVLEDDNKMIFIDAYESSYELCSWKCAADFASKKRDE